MRLRISQGINDRVAVKTTYTQRWSLSGFPHLVQDDLYDSPILDSYASTTSYVESSIRTLVPWQVWLEGGADTENPITVSCSFQGQPGAW